MTLPYTSTMSMLPTQTRLRKGACKNNNSGTCIQLINNLLENLVDLTLTVNTDQKAT